MQKFTNLAKLTHRFADTCCYTNLKSKILTQARCGNTFQDNSPEEPMVLRKRKQRCCPLERDDIRSCPKCLQIAEAIFSAYKNTSLWINDDALSWFATQQDTRRLKRKIFEEYMKTEDAPMILYTPDGIKFIPPPLKIKKEKKHKLDPNKFKRISPEFLRLLQRHHDILHRTKVDKPDHESEAEEIQNANNKNTKSWSSLTNSNYLKCLKRFNLQPPKTEFQELPVSFSRTSFTKKNYFNKKGHKTRFLGGKDERHSSSATYLKTLYINNLSPTYGTPLRATHGLTSLNRLREGKDYNWNTASGVQTIYRLGSHLRSQRDLNKLIQEKPWNLAQRSRALTTKSTTKQLPTSIFCSLCDDTSTSNFRPFEKAQRSRTLEAKALTKRLPIPTYSSLCDASACNDRPVVHRYQYRQKGFKPESPIINTLRCVGNPSELKSNPIKRKRSRAQIQSADTHAIPLRKTYLLGAADGQYKKMFPPSSHLSQCRHVDILDNKGKLNAVYSNMSISTSSYYIVDSLGNPFDTRTSAQSIQLPRNTNRKMTLTPTYVYTAYAPSTSNVQTQTILSATNCAIREAKSTQTLMEAQDSVSHVKIQTPPSSSCSVATTSSPRIEEPPVKIQTPPSSSCNVATTNRPRIEEPPVKIQTHPSSSCNVDTTSRPRIEEQKHSEIKKPNRSEIKKPSHYRYPRI